uniref:Solute carrier family 25 member 33 n=1 Tax=Loxodonta africana TaxID=9785 RepID=G3U7E3_LOXAF
MATGAQQKENTLLHLFAGECGGTVGAIFTCPLEVIKTRLQSSRLALRTVYYPQVHLGTISGAGMVRPTSVTPGLLQVLKSILEKEGPKSLFRGLGPNLVGVAPSSGRNFLCNRFYVEGFEGVCVCVCNHMHICYMAQHTTFVTNSLMNPIWMVKTRMQLERRVRGSKQMNTLQCARYVYQTEGIRGFYRGLTASYAGISETIICFAIYESLKKYLKGAPLASSTNGTEKNSTNFFGLMAAAAVSKGCASCIAYPHEVIRTRVRKAPSTSLSSRPHASCFGKKVTLPSIEDSLPSSSGRYQILPLCCLPMS